MTLTHGHHQDSNQMDSGHIPAYPGILMLSGPWLLWEQESCVVKIKVKTDVNIHVFPGDDFEFWRFQFPLKWNLLKGPYLVLHKAV